MRHIPFFLLLALATTAHAQRLDANDSTAAASTRGTVLSTSRPEDMFAEWLLLLRNGNVISADEPSIAWKDGQIAVRGTLRSLTVPASDIRAVSMVPAQSGFRNGFAGTLFFSSMILFSPTATPGYYVGTIRSSSDNINIPGMSFASVLLAAGASVTAGVLAQLSQPAMNTVSLDGSEDEAVWRLLLEDRSPRWHLHGAASFITSSQTEDWKAAHTRWAFKPSQPAQNSYYSYSSTPDMTNLNLGRMIRVGYSVTPAIEVGVGYQADGVQRFYEEVSYTRPGTPPQPIVQQVWNEATSTHSFAFCQYRIVNLNRAIAFHAGAGIGIASGKLQVNNYDSRATNVALGDYRSLGFVLFASIDYALDRSMSLGLIGDFSSFGVMPIPEQRIQDYDRRVYIVVPSFDLNMRNAGIGLQLGLHW
ncbi:MAG: hypothetical protein IPP94_11790 [Ignavibacteria bacterium]|nr:hypothetical protein [Ignavibacteria bacterium]